MLPPLDKRSFRRVSRSTWRPAAQIYRRWGSPRRVDDHLVCPPRGGTYRRAPKIGRHPSLKGGGYPPPPGEELTHPHNVCEPLLMKRGVWNPPHEKGGPKPGYIFTEKKVFKKLTPKILRVNSPPAPFCGKRSPQPKEEKNCKEERGFSQGV